MEIFEGLLVLIIPQAVFRCKGGQADAEQVRFAAEDGDCVILQSDGVAQGSGDSPWLLRLLSRSWDGDLGRMCARILDEAEKNNPASDDRSVCIVRIRRAG